MIKAAKCFGAFFVSVVVLIVLNSFFPSAKFLSAPWFIAIIIAFFNYLFVYLTTSPREIKLNGIVTKEYIVSGHGEIMEEVNDSYFQKMELLEKTDEGRCFIHSNGSMVTTKYVSKNEMTVVKKIIFPNIIYSVFSTFAMLVIICGFCQQTNFNLSEVKSIVPALENGIFVFQERLEPVSKNSEKLSTDMTQIKNEINSALIEIQKGVIHAVDRIFCSSKTLENSAKKAVAKNEKNVEITENSLVLFSGRRLKQ